MYHTYVHCTHMHAGYGQYARDLKTRADLDTIDQLFRIPQFIAICSEHRYSEYFQKSTKTIAR